MKFNNIKSKGFTIVELLVVITVIGILAAITIISYSGITAKANTSKGLAQASSVIDRANIYTVEGSTGTWPLTAALAMSQSGLSMNPITGVTVIASAAITTAPATTTPTISYQVCGTTSNIAAVFTKPANLAAITNPTGVIVGYWDYSITTPAQATIASGNTVVDSVGPYRVGANTYANLVACYYTPS